MELLIRLFFLILDIIFSVLLIYLAWYLFYTILKSKLLYNKEQILNTYYTELDIEECKKRIKDEIKENWYSLGEMTGRVNFRRNKFYLIKPNEMSVNSCTKYFYGRMVKKEHGTIIQGNFRLHIFTKVFMVYIFSFLSVISGILILLCFKHHFLGFSYEESIALLAPSIFFTFEIVTVKAGIRNSEEGEKYILSFIKSTLEANEAECTN